MDRTFQKFGGEKINDPVEYVKDYTGGSDDFEIVIGTDSQVYSNYTKFVTAICMYDGDRGAHVIYHSNNVHREERDLFNRLWEEAQTTIDVAGALSSEVGTSRVVTHFDINPSEEHRSNVAHRAAVGMAESAGYSFNVKPDAWAATCAADRLN